jgi:hypothetical protein
LNGILQGIGAFVALVLDCAIFALYAILGVLFLVGGVAFVGGLCLALWAEEGAKRAIAWGKE